MKENKWYKRGEGIGAIAATFMIATIMLVIVFAIFSIEALVLWGIGSLALYLLGLGTCTYGQCFAVVLIIDLISAFIHKIFFKNN